MDTTWESISSLARTHGAKYPDLVAAQWALESGWGKHVSGKNNFFGIKGKGTVVTTTEFINGKEVVLKDEFKDFDSADECVQWLVDHWYKDYKTYKGVNRAGTVEEAANQLVTQGYATDPSYATKLVKLLQSHTPDQPSTTMSNFSPDKFFDFALFANDENPKHRAAFHDLYREIMKLKPELLTDDANWVRIYRTKPENEPGVKNVLDVPYFSQRDNYRDAARTCFSSSCAMLCEFLKPGTLAGAKGDDKYVEQVFKRGDSTDASVQVQTLRHFGVSAKFITNGTFSLLDSLLAKGIPVPIGILHKGPASAPSGGGHWICVIGREGDRYVVNDPWGEIDHASGTYISNNGAGLYYSKKLLAARWTVEGDGSGWAIVASK